MGSYIKKIIREQMEIIDSRTNDLPNKWNKFINNQSKAHNLLIKTGDKCHCTYCDKDFNSKMKIKETDTCPYCKQKLTIRGSNLKKEKFVKDVMLLDKIDNQIILRIFELQSIYQPEFKKFKNIPIEYGRIIVGDKNHLVNERIYFSMYGYVVYNKAKPGKWRNYISYYGLCSRNALYPYNIKQILKGTIYEYSLLWEFIKKVPRCDMENLLTGSAKYPSFELLVKMKLYNLALDAATYNVKGDFKTRFGVGKEYYDFMKKHNITSEELEILKLIQTPDMKMTKYLKKISNKYEREDVSKYVRLDKVYRYIKNSKVRKFDMGIYSDYLEFADQLGMNMKDKKVLFPKNLKELHDKYYKRVKIVKNEQVCKNIIKRANELLKNQFQDKKYIVFPAGSINDLKDESKQQNHCIQNYAERYANATCDIYFMRLIENMRKSLVTIEVRDNKIVQKKIKGNDPPTEEQNLFLEKWQQTVLQNCRV